MSLRHSIRALMPALSTRLASTVLTVMCLHSADAIPLPYAADADTLILYHLDETSGSSLVNSANITGWNGIFSVATASTATPSPLTSAAAYPAFGKAILNGPNQGVTVDTNNNGSWNFDGIEPGDRFPMTQLGTSFTLEVMVKLPSLSSGNQHLWSGDGNTQRAFQFRIENGGTLRFDPDPGGTSVSFNLASITSPHSFVPDQWFHVAMTYDASGGPGTELVKFYWTSVNNSSTAANLVFTSSPGAVTFSPSLAAPLVLGNEGRSPVLGETLIGAIDEARVSKIARTPDAFIFRSIAVTATSGNWEASNPAANTLDGNLTTRASAQGDGSSITYQISGSPATVESVGIAFYNGDSRSYLFDVLTSQDGINWSTALAGAKSSGSSLALQRFELPSPRAANHLRIVGHGHDGDPNSFNSYTEFVVNPPSEDVADSDGDGLPDRWEIDHLGSLSLNAYNDPDGDGYTNLEEYVAGTSPAATLSHPLWESPKVRLLKDSVPSTNARLFASSATYGRAINGISYQDQILLTHAGRQYTAWYDNSTLTVFLARRTVNGSTTGNWEVVNTGSTFVNGVSGDAHNVISLGICAADGTLHMSWDHHGNTLRYRRSVLGLCTTNTSAWGANMLNPERNWLVSSTQSIPLVTYPLFIATPTGGLAFQWRYGSSGAGANMLSFYSPSSATWSSPLQFDAGTGTYVEGTYSSTSRNAYLNGLDFAPDGTMHITWTWREGAGTSNHDICFASSQDQGITWKNNAGVQIANTSLAQRITLTSPGSVIERKDMNQLLINQQTQCVDAEGRVHMMMLHRREDPGYEFPNQSTALFSIIGTAYYHYFRDPASGAWNQRRIPPEIAPVGSRPSMGYDSQGNLYAVYLTYPDRSQVFPGYRGGYLAIATASKNSTYSNWRVVYTGTTLLQGEPKLDQARLTNDAILSIFVQEDSSSTSAVGTPLHVFDFAAEPVTNPDSDEDGLMDSWEMLHFQNLLQGPLGDPDGDGFDNLTEQAYRTNPTRSASVPGDTDEDGLNDEWEISNFGNLESQNSAGDPDGDFASNLLESKSGTNPNDARSWPDRDADGLNDGWELACFASLDQDNNDFDGDGALNSAEMAAGSDPTDPASRPNRSRLDHRWSFNGTLTDAAGDSDASIIAVGTNKATLGTTSITMTGGAKSNSDYVKLGSRLLSGRMTPVTLELWATHNQIQNWGRIFDFNLDTSEYLFMSWSVGTTANSDRVAWKQAPGAEAAPPNASNAPYVIGTPYHILLTITPACFTRGAIATGSRVTVFTAAATTTSLGTPRATFDTSYQLTNLDDVMCALGWSPWADNTASASYDEVRIWEGALTAEEREGNHADGPNLIRDPTDLDGDGLPDAWELSSFGNTGLQTAMGDADGDGTNNLTEFRLGLNPRSGNSRFAASWKDDQLQWPGAAGAVFIIQRSSDATLWQNLATRTGTNGTNSFVDPAPPPLRSFYRVMLK